MRVKGISTEKRLPELDGIRGSAISLVLFAHFVHGPILSGTSRLTDFIRQNLTLGFTGVDLFFVLSGFLIGGILLDHRNSPGYFKAFYARRVCRILPMYYLLLVTCGAGRYLFSAHSAEQWYNSMFITGISMGAYATFTQDIIGTVWHNGSQSNSMWLAPTWSLTLEEQFYLLLPLTIRFVRPSWWLSAFCISFCLHPIAYLVLWMYNPMLYDKANMILPTRADALLLGVICAWLFRQEKCRNWLVQYRDMLYVALGLLSLGALYIAHESGVTNFEFDSIFSLSWMAFLYAAILLLAVTHKDGPVARVMRFGPLRKLGIIAYGVYLINNPMNGLLHGLILGTDCYFRSFASVFVNFLALGVTIVLAAISWRFFEKPIIKLGHAFPYDNPRRIVQENAGDVKITEQIE